MNFNPEKDQKLDAFLNFFRDQKPVGTLYSNMEVIETEFEDMIQMTKKLNQVYHELTSQPTLKN